MQMLALSWRSLHCVMATQSPLRSSHWRSCRSLRWVYVLSHSLFLSKIFFSCLILCYVSSSGAHSHHLHGDLSEAGELFVLHQSFQILYRYSNERTGGHILFYFFQKTIFKWIQVIMLTESKRFCILSLLTSIRLSLIFEKRITFFGKQMETEQHDLLCSVLPQFTVNVLSQMCWAAAIGVCVDICQGHMKDTHPEPVLLILKNNHFQHWLQKPWSHYSLWWVCEHLAMKNW